MTRLLRTVAPLLAVSLLLQIVFAPVHCLAKARTAGGFDTVICTAEGTRIIHVDAERQGHAPQIGLLGICVVCIGMARVATVEPSLLVAPADRPVARAWRPAAAMAWASAARAPPYAPRAPPAPG
ncbi:hypothetical protein KPL78_08665 [Roseomonas sp. HJA6]|uniref:DUF2946 domain-containing protein n=1 Tax=Roseomonas alba TaxID=2846776 RepID=A0ABS7A6I6_9PROT|nr:hypothetical protein [Neoroseomonas alba]MBW6397914.1 hypothetical protein [Neoroseomonas alba]